MKKVFAIAGMGLCGNAVFCRLIQMLSSSHNLDEITILLFEERQEYFATGFAYASD